MFSIKYLHSTTAIIALLLGSHFAACNKAGFGQNRELKISTPSESVQGFIKSAEAGDVKAVKRLIAERPVNAKVECESSQSAETSPRRTIADSEQMREPKSTPRLGSSKANGPFLKADAGSEDEKAIYSIANHIQRNTYGDTASSIINSKKSDDRALLLVKRGDFRNSITILLAFSLIRESDGWKIFDIKPILDEEEFQNIEFGNSRDTCDE